MSHRSGDDGAIDPSVPGYRLGEVIGRGSSATVYSAVQEAFGRTVALKVLHVDVSDRRVQRRFEREKAIGGRLSNHPNVATVLDAGFVDRRYPYLAMELFDHGSLSERLAARGPYPVADVLRIGVRIAGALHSAHLLGILHRDVKPQNILLSRFGEPALADFGIATILELEQSMTAALTPVHAAPEILEGGEPSASSDVYALASSLYTLLSGAPPFAGPPGEGVLAQLLRITTSELPRLQRSDVPPELFDVLRAATTKDPAQRTPDAATFGRQLQAIESSLGLERTSLPIDTPATPAGATLPPPTASAPTTPSTPGAPAATSPPSAATPDPFTDPAPAGAPPAAAATPSSSPTASPVGTPPPPRASQPRRDDPTIDGTPADAFGAATIDARQLPPEIPASPPRRRWRRVAAIGVVAGAVAGATFLFANRGGDDEPTTTPTTTAAVPIPLGSDDIDQPLDTEASPESVPPVDPDIDLGPIDSSTSAADADLAPTGLAYAVADDDLVISWHEHTAEHSHFVEIELADGTHDQHLATQRETYVIEDFTGEEICVVVRVLVRFDDDGQPVTADSDPMCVSGPRLTTTTT